MTMKEIEGLFRDALRKMGMGDENIQIKLEHPLLKEHGDYASNIAFQLAKSLKKAPFLIAQEIAAHFPYSSFILKVEAVQPGFVNVWLSAENLWGEARAIVESGETYGSPTKSISLRVLVEHTQVNPNKEPHIGHLRNACIGDAIVRLYRFAHHDAKAFYYQNDVGQQISSIVLAYEKQFVRKDDFPSLITWASQAYSDIDKRMEEDASLRAEKEAIQLEIAGQSTPRARLAEELTSTILKELLHVLSHLGIEYDLIVRESDILKNALWEKTFELLKVNGAFYKATEGERKDCWLIKMPNAEDKVIVRSNGVPTYVGNDIANHLWKFGLLDDFRYIDTRWDSQKAPLFITSVGEGDVRGDFSHADSIVNIIDQTQTYPQESVIESLRVLGFTKQAENYHHVNYGFVYLSRKTAEKFGMKIEDDARQIKISGRKGTVVSVERFLEEMERMLKEQHGDFESLEEVRNGAVKFELLKYDTYQDIVFDLDAALDLRGFSGPYLQYAYTRAASVLRKAGVQEKVANLSDVPADSEAEKPVLRILYRFPEVVEKALADHAPHYVCLYLFELAQTFNAFYNENRVIGSANEAERLLLTQAVAVVLKNGLGLLGISAPEKM